LHLSLKNNTIDKVLQFEGERTMKKLKESIRVASGQGKVDLLIKNGRVVNVFSGQIERTDVAIWNGLIVGFGDYQAKKVLDAEGAFLCPGLIDGHVHIESSMVTVPEFARAILPHGTTTVVADPHEIANVLGPKGVRCMAASAEGIPLNVFFMIPSCVPATHMETAGAVLRAEDIRALLREPWALGLAEMMNFPESFMETRRSSKRSKRQKGKGSMDMPPSFRERVCLHTWRQAFVQTMRQQPSKRQRRN
jgi:adenine deaminase